MQRIEAITNRKELSNALNFSEELLPELSSKENLNINKNNKTERDSQNMNCTICVSIFYSISRCSKMPTKNISKS